MLNNSYSSFLLTIELTHPRLVSKAGWDQTETAPSPGRKACLDGLRSLTLRRKGKSFARFGPGALYRLRNGDVQLQLCDCGRL